MDVNAYKKVDYENLCIFRLRKNKPNPSGHSMSVWNCRTDQSQFQARRGFFCLLHKRLPRPFGPRNDILWRFYIKRGREEGNCSSRLLFNRIKAIYKPVSDRYYNRHICRCSSMVEHSFRKAEVEGSTPSIGFIEAVLIFILSFHMSLGDTSAEAEEILCRLYRNMTIAQKAQRLFSAYRMGKMLSMAGIRMNHPDATEEQVWHLWARRHLGDELYERVYQGRNGNDTE